MKRLSVLLTICALAGTLAFAQGSATEPVRRHGEGFHMHYLTKALGLTAAQQAQAHSIFAASASSRSATHTSMKTASQALETAVKNNDPGAIEQAAATIGNLTAEATAARAKADAALYLILTPEQQAKFSQLRGHGHGWGGPMGRGGYVQWFTAANRFARSSPRIYPESKVPVEVQNCLALARRVEFELAEGDRLIAARAAVDLARAYDKALDNLRLPRFSLQEAQSLRGQLAPVADLLRKCRLR